MLQFKRIFAIIGLVAIDIVTVVASLLLTFKVIAPSSPTIVPQQYLNDGYYIFLMIGMSMTLIGVNIICGNYSTSLKHYSFGEIIRTVAAVGIIFLGMTVFSAAFETDRFDFRLISIVCIFSLILQVFGRSVVRMINEVSAKVTTTAKSKNADVRKVIVYGAGEAGVSLCNKARQHKELDINPVAFIDDDPTLTGKKVHGLKVYGDFTALGDTIDKTGAQEVIVAIPTAPKQLLKKVMEVCREKRCMIRKFGTIDDIQSNASLQNINIEELLRRDSVSLNMNVVRRFVENKTVIVTGGAGSIGSEICRQVLKFGCKHLVIFDIHENGLYDIENELKAEYDGKYSMRLGSIRDVKRLKEVFDEFQPQLVFHAAAHKHVPMMEYSPREAIKNNVKGTINVAQAAIMHKVEKMILISTDKAVNPTNIMGASKRIAEEAIQLMDTLSDTDFAAVRFGNVLGSNGSVVPLFRKQIEAGGPVTVTHPDMRRYFMTIPEAVQLVLEAGAMANGGEIFVLDMGEPVRIYDLACDLIKLSGNEPNEDIEIKFTGLRPGEKLFEELSIHGEDMQKTPNGKIFIMKPMEFDETERADQIKELEASAVSDKPLSDMFQKVKVLVPTFHHNPDGKTPDQEDSETDK